MKIWIVKKTGIEEKEFDQITAEEVGQKTLGLCCVPSAWTLPFFVIVKDLFLEISNSEKNKQKIMKSYISNILYAIDNLKLGDNLIVRSSGTKEGMAERGKYESVVSDKINIENKILELINLLKRESELIENGMPLIIQAHIKSDITGHVSNERRFAKERRDFIYEYCDESKQFRQVEMGNISLRNWRKKYNVEDYVDRSLCFGADLIEKLKVVCAKYCYENNRIHIEFIYDRNILYIVQCDFETEIQGAVDPDKYDIKMFEKENEFTPIVLKLITDEDKGKYKKIDNVFIYKEVGVPMPPLYILDDENCLECLKQGKILEQLKSDLSYMTKTSLVIRTNVISDEKLKSQFSQRSNELRNVDSAIEFLQKASAEISKEGIQKYIFILHNFIPAKIAAFVNAKPLERIVEIQALWGLPEGLYYNAHDRISVDTKEISIDKMKKDEFSISKSEVYKECFIAPDDSGKWILKKLKSRYNWRCTINNDEIIREIAERARKITENVGNELSIMWFIGIDEIFYKTNNIPWYHENYDRNSYYSTNNSNVETNFKKKYFYETEVMIETQEDLANLKNRSSREIGLVRIKPKEDDILRSKEFIKEVGELCKEKGVNIFLEGAVLAHSFYQLLSTGATVILAHEMKHYKDEVEFNKLVRDRIPEIIEQNGEHASCIILEGLALVRQLKNKIIEESYEILAANSKETVLEELADLEEVCIALEEKVDLVRRDQVNISETSYRGVTLLFEGAVLENCKQDIYHDKNIKFVARLERKGSDLQLDIFLGNNNDIFYNPEPKFYIEDEKKTILNLAFQIFLISNIDECRQLIRQIRAQSLQVREKYSCKQEEFNRIRIQKKEKKGGFEKGFILLRAGIYDERPEEKVDEIIFNQIRRGENIQKVNFDLPIKSRIDIENLNTSQLLIRLTFPIYLRKMEWNIRRKIVNDFFERNVEIKIARKFIDTKIEFNIGIEEENYRQLVLDFRGNIKDI